MSKEGSMVLVSEQKEQRDEAEEHLELVQKLTWGGVGVEELDAIFADFFPPQNTVVDLDGDEGGPSANTPEVQPPEAEELLVPEAVVISCGDAVARSECHNDPNWEVPVIIVSGDSNSRDNNGNTISDCTIEASNGNISSDDDICIGGHSPQIRIKIRHAAMADGNEEDPPPSGLVGQHAHKRQRMLAGYDGGEKASNCAKEGGNALPVATIEIDSDDDVQVNNRTGKTWNNVKEVGNVLTLPMVEIDSDDDVQVIYAKGPVATRDWPHVRHDCGMHPFTSGQTGKGTKVNERFCQNCFCFVCAIKASECKQWKAPAGEHCNAEGKNPHWDILKKIASFAPELPLGNLQAFAKDRDEVMSHVTKLRSIIARFSQAGISQLGPMDLSVDATVLSVDGECSCEFSSGYPEHSSAMSDCICHLRGNPWDHRWVTRISSLGMICAAQVDTYLEDHDPGSALALLEVMTKLVVTKDILLGGLYSQEALDQLGNKWMVVLLRWDVSKEARRFASDLFKKLQASVSLAERFADSTFKIAVRAATDGWEKPELKEVLSGRRPVIAEPEGIFKARMDAFQAAGRYEEALRYVRAVSMLEDGAMALPRDLPAAVREGWKLRLLCKMGRFSEILNALMEKGAQVVPEGNVQVSLVDEVLEQDIDMAVAIGMRIIRSGRGAKETIIFLVRALCERFHKASSHTGFYHLRVRSEEGSSNQLVPSCQLDTVDNCCTAFNDFVLCQSVCNSSMRVAGTISVCNGEHRCSTCGAAGHGGVSCQDICARGMMGGPHTSEKERLKAVQAAAEVPTLCQLASQALAKKLVMEGVVSNPKVTTEIMDKLGDSVITYFTRLYIFVYAFQEDIEHHHRFNIPLDYLCGVVTTLMEFRHYGIAAGLVRTIYKHVLTACLCRWDRDDYVRLKMARWLLLELLPWEGPNPCKEAALAAGRLENKLSALVIGAIHEAEEQAHSIVTIGAWLARLQAINCFLLKEFEVMSQKMIAYGFVSSALEVAIAMIQYEAALVKRPDMSKLPADAWLAFSSTAGLMEHLVSRLTSIQCRRLCAIHLKAHNLSRASLCNFVLALMLRPGHDCHGHLLRLAVRAVAPSTQGDFPPFFQHGMVEDLLDLLDCRTFIGADACQTSPDIPAGEKSFSLRVNGKDPPPGSQEQQQCKHCRLGDGKPLLQELAFYLFAIVPSLKAYKCIRDGFISSTENSLGGVMSWRISDQCAELHAMLERAASRNAVGSEKIKRARLELICLENEVDKLLPAASALMSDVPDTLSSALKVCEECCEKGESRQEIVRQLAITAAAHIWDSPRPGLSVSSAAAEEPWLAGFLRRVAVVNIRAALEGVGRWLESMKNFYLKRTMTARVREEFRLNLLWLKDVVAAICKEHGRLLWQWVIYSTGIAFRAKPAVQRILSQDEELNQPLGPPDVRQASSGRLRPSDEIPLVVKQCRTIEEFIKVAYETELPGLPYLLALGGRSESNTQHMDDPQRGIFVPTSNQVFTSEPHCSTYLKPYRQHVACASQASTAGPEAGPSNAIQVPALPTFPPGYLNLAGTSTSSRPQRDFFMGASTSAQHGHGLFPGTTASASAEHGHGSFPTSSQHAHGCFPEMTWRGGLCSDTHSRLSVPAVLNEAPSRSGEVSSARNGNDIAPVMQNSHLPPPPLGTGTGTLGNTLLHQGMGAVGDVTMTAYQARPLGPTTSQLLEPQAANRHGVNVCAFGPLPRTPGALPTAHRSHLPPVDPMATRSRLQPQLFHPQGGMWGPPPVEPFYFPYEPGSPHLNQASSSL